TGVIAALCGCGHGGVVEGDSESLAAHQVVSRHPGGNGFHPEAPDACAVWTGVAQVGDLDRRSFDDRDFHGGLLGCGDAILPSRAPRRLTTLARHLTALALSPFRWRAVESCA